MFPIPKRKNNKPKIYTSWNTGQTSRQVYDSHEQHWMLNLNSAMLVLCVILEMNCVHCLYYVLYLKGLVCNVALCVILKMNGVQCLYV